MKNTTILVCVHHHLSYYLQDSHFLEYMKIVLRREYGCSSYKSLLEVHILQGSH